MSQTPSKKRPPKLKLTITQDTPTSGPSSCDIPTQQSTRNNESKATSEVDDSNLDSKVEVQLGNQQKFLIRPDDLTVVQQLGRGQYGIVEKVFHKDSGHYFAVKRVELAISVDENERIRLLMDVDILVKGTECKNIIKFYGALLWEGYLWILMELMDCSLHKFYRTAHRNVDTPIILNNKKQPKRVMPGPCSHLSDNTVLGNCSICNPIPETVLGRMSSDIVNALSYLYSIKVIHRDIKPSNILIDRLGIIKLCDFGISGYLINSVARTVEAGCRPYMAPERIDPGRGDTGYDIKSDVWSFGITMFEIATGRYPYNQTRDVFKQVKSICLDEPPRLPPGRFSPVFEDFISQCLRKDCRSRPKYDAIESHPFIKANKDLDIREFTEKVITTMQ